MTVAAQHGKRTSFNDMVELVDFVRGATIHRSAHGVALAKQHSGKLILLDTATVDYTLPAIAPGDDDGLRFEFQGTIVSTNQSIVAQAGDFLNGALVLVGTTTGNFAANGSSHLTVSLNGTTTGGSAAGSKLSFVALDGEWHMSGTLIASGTVATPIS